MNLSAPRKEHLPESQADIAALTQDPRFLSDWRSHLESCLPCISRLQSALRGSGRLALPPLPPLPPIATTHSSTEKRGLRRHLVLWSAVAAMVLILSGFLVVPRLHGGIDLVFLVQKEGAVPAVNPSGVLPLDIEVVPPDGEPPHRGSAAIDLAVGAGLIRVSARPGAVVLARTRDGGPPVAGVTRVKRGLNLLELGGPGSAALADHDHVASLLGDRVIGPGLVRLLPFDVSFVGTAHAADHGNSTLSAGVGVVYFDDLGILDGDQVIWSESFEGVPVGGYPAAPADSIYPHPEIPMEAGGDLPRGIVTTAEQANGDRAFLSLSVPKRARIDGVRIHRGDIHSGVIRYRASVFLNSVDSRGALLSLKQEAGQLGRWYDKAGLLFCFGEIRTWSSNQLVGYYESGRWYQIEVTVHLEAHTMDVRINNREAARAAPVMGGEGIAAEHPDWSPGRVWEGFDTWSFGGVFFAGPEAGSDVPLSIESETEEFITYRLDGARPMWQPTTLAVAAGDTLRIDATGEMRDALPGPSRTDPDGYHLVADRPPEVVRSLPDVRANVPAPGQWIGALVARVGNGEPFFVGRSAVVVVKEVGRLQFAYNDSWYGDNEGEFFVRVGRITR